MPSREIFKFAKVFSLVKSQEPQNATINLLLEMVIQYYLYIFTLNFIPSVYGTCADGSYCPAHFSRKNLQPRGGCPGFPSSSIQLLAQKPLLCSTCGLDHGRIELADGIFHSLQLVRYLTQEQYIQNSCSMLFQHPAVFAWKQLRVHRNFASPCEQKASAIKAKQKCLVH